MIGLNIILGIICITCVVIMWRMIETSRVKEDKTYLSDTGDEISSIYRCTCVSNAQKNTCKKMQDRENKDFCNENL